MDGVMLGMLIEMIVVLWFIARIVRPPTINVSPTATATSSSTSEGGDGGKSGGVPAWIVAAVVVVAGLAVLGQVGEQKTVEQVAGVQQPAQVPVVVTVIVPTAQSRVDAPVMSNRESLDSSSFVLLIICAVIVLAVWSFIRFCREEDGAEHEGGGIPVGNGADIFSDAVRSQAKK